MDELPSEILDNMAGYVHETGTPFDLINISHNTWVSIVSHMKAVGSITPGEQMCTCTLALEELSRLPIKLSTALRLTSPP